MASRGLPQRRPCANNSCAVWCKSLSTLTCVFEPSTFASEYIYRKWPEKTIICHREAIHWICPVCPGGDRIAEMSFFVLKYIYMWVCHFTPCIACMINSTELTIARVSGCLVSFGARGTMQSFAVYKIVIPWNWGAGKIHLSSWLSSTKTMPTRRRF